MNKALGAISGCLFCAWLVVIGFLVGEGFEKRRCSLTPGEQVFIENARQALKKHVQTYGWSTNDQWKCVITRFEP